MESDAVIDTIAWLKTDSAQQDQHTKQSSTKRFRTDTAIKLSHFTNCLKNQGKMTASYVVTLAY